MKLAKSVQLLAVALALSFTVVGCRKGLDKTTGIPGQRAGSIVDSNPNPIRGLNQGGVVPPVNPGRDGTGVFTEPGKPVDPNAGGTGGIAAAKGDFSDWKENREEFAALTVYFDFDKSNIKPGEVSKLEEVAKKMKASFQGKALRIEGHCDERGSTRYNISKNQLMKQPIQLPCLREQTKIANFLTALDRKIESVSQQIALTQTFKRGLLQQMFV